MVFSSFEFLCIFLPVLCIVYAILPSIRWKNGLLIIGSLLFYAYGEPVYVLLMIGSSLVHYLLAMGISKSASAKNPLLALDVILSLVVLGLFKYTGMIVTTINQIAHSNIPVPAIVMPIGISFFTFQSMSYVIDVYRERVEVQTNFFKVLLYISFFPQLIAGPIVLHNEILPQFEDKKNWKIQWDNLAHGAYIFAAGLVKKVVIADTLSSAVAWGYGHLGRNLTSAEAIITMLAYTFQIYFDFSGYCDMATGLGYLFNIHIPMNFNSPYKATSVVDFWKRWHLTLTRFLRTYVYFPLGGSRKGEVRTYINIIAVFLVSGLWHGANWTFILWGFLHGMGNALTRMFRKQWGHLHTVIQWGITFLFVNLTWIFFRADSISQAVNFIRRIFGFQSFSVRDGLLNTFGLKELKFIYCHIPILNRVIASVHGFDMLILLTASLILCLVFKNNQEMEFKPDTKKAVFTVLCLIWGIFSLSGVSEFLYFNF